MADTGRIFTSQPCNKCGCSKFRKSYNYRDGESFSFGRRSPMFMEEEEPDYVFICTSCGNREIVPRGIVVQYLSDGFVSRYGNVRKQ